MLLDKAQMEQTYGKTGQTRNPIGFLSAHWEDASTNSTKCVARKKRTSSTRRREEASVACVRNKPNEHKLSESNLRLIWLRTTDGSLGDTPPEKRNNICSHFTRLNFVESELDVYSLAIHS